MAKTGMVIVSHSEEIANGVVKLSSEMANDTVEFRAAGGTGDGRLGTSAMTVLKAIESLSKCKSILIYCDLGSSVLSSETAIDMIDNTLLRAKCHIVDAPLVEGAFFGAVEAAASDDVQKIITESDNARNLHKN